jgi:hypothetical protein
MPSTFLLPAPLDNSSELRSVVRFLVAAGGIEGITIAPRALTGLEPAQSSGLRVSAIVGLIAAALTIGIGLLLHRADARGRMTAWGGAIGPITGPLRTSEAQPLAIAAVLLIWPFGLLLGPAALAMGISQLHARAWKGADIYDVASIRRAAAIGGLVCAAYLFGVFAQAAAYLWLGSFIPSPP